MCVSFIKTSVSCKTFTIIMWVPVLWISGHNLLSFCFWSTRCLSSCFHWCLSHSWPGYVACLYLLWCCHAVEHHSNSSTSSLAQWHAWFVAHLSAIPGAAITSTCRAFVLAIIASSVGTASLSSTHTARYIITSPCTCYLMAKPGGQNSILL